jgi:hypothetical protein
VTSHSSQGQTADRVLIQADTEAGEKFVNRRMAYALCPVAATTRKSTRRTRETSLKGLGIRPRRFAPLRNRAKFRPRSELRPRTQDGTCGSDQAPEQSVDRELGMGRQVRG